MTVSEREQLVELANRNSRPVSEEILRRLRATLANQEVWEDASQLAAQNLQTARRLLLEKGWQEWDDPNYGGVIILPPGTAPPGPFITWAEAKEPLPAIVADANLERFVRALLVAANIPVGARAPLRYAVLEALAKIVPKKEREEGKGAAKAKGKNAAA